MKQWIFGSALAFLALLSGCVSAPENEIRIGVVLPLSGENAPSGKRMLLGIRAAMDALNARGGVETVPLTLEVVDMRSRPEQLDPALRELSSRSVRAVLAGYTSGDVQHIKSAANELGLPILLPSASQDNLVEHTAMIARSAFNDSQQSKALAYYARFEKRLSRMGCLIDTDENAVYSRDIGRKVAQEFAAYGGSVVKRAGFRNSDADFRPALRQLIAADAEVIIAPAGPDAAARLVIQARELGFRGLILGSDGWNEKEFFDRVGTAPGDVVFPAQYSPTAATPSQLEMLKHARISADDLGDAGVQGYDAMNILAVALRTGERGVGLAEAIRRVRRHPTIVGEITILNDGNAERRIFLQSVRSNEGKATSITILALEADRIGRRLRVDQPKPEN